MVGEQVVWEGPSDVEQTWLEKHDYARVSLEVSRRGTEFAQNEDLGRIGIDAMAQVYFARVE